MPSSEDRNRVRSKITRPWAAGKALGWILEPRLVSFVI